MKITKTFVPTQFSIKAEGGKNQQHSGKIIKDRWIFVVTDGQILTGESNIAS